MLVVLIVFAITGAGSAATEFRLSFAAGSFLSMFAASGTALCLLGIWPERARRAIQRAQGVRTKGDILVCKRAIIQFMRLSAG